jgi:hypothetical protein
MAQTVQLCSLASSKSGSPAEDNMKLMCSILVSMNELYKTMTKLDQVLAKKDIGLTSSAFDGMDALYDALYRLDHVITDYTIKKNKIEQIMCN